MEPRRGPLFSTCHVGSRHCSGWSPIGCSNSAATQPLRGQNHPHHTLSSFIIPFIKAPCLQNKTIASEPRCAICPPRRPVPPKLQTNWKVTERLCSLLTPSNQSTAKSERSSVLSVTQKVPPVHLSSRASLIHQTQTFPCTFLPPPGHMAGLYLCPLRYTFLHSVTITYNDTQLAALLEACSPQTGKLRNGRNLAPPYVLP